jgi:F-type H+-transporting ATPase subunit a
VLLATGLKWAILHRPRSLPAVIARLAVQWPEQLVGEVVGRPVPWLAVFSGSLFYFLAGCSIAGQLPGVRTPTANLAVTSALAVLVFLTVPAAGIRSQGVWRYLGHYLRPSPLMLPFELMSELSRTFALSMRLFGNMLSGYLIVALLVALAGVFVPIPLMALDLLIGLLQAYIFAVLTTVYVGAALRTKET